MKKLIIGIVIFTTGMLFASEKLAPVNPCNGMQVR